MISVKEAKEIIVQQVHSARPVRVSLHDAAGYALAEDVYAPMDIPAYTQSSMDGYAFLYTEKNMHLKVAGEMAAGANAIIEIAGGEAARIFTGAPLPKGADTVVMQEKVIAGKGFIQIKDDALQPASHVRMPGTEIRAGQIALQKKTKLTPAALAFLAGSGIHEVEIFPAPKVCIIITGNELQQPGLPLLFGQVYESNSFSLTAALRQAGIFVIHICSAKDTLDATQAALDVALQEYDVILFTGGISAGDYDFVLQSTEKCGVEKHFYKVKQKPGKPLYFGTTPKNIVFGLPGNPASVLTCFYEYVLPALEKIMQQPPAVKVVYATITADYRKPAGLTHFLKAIYKGDALVLPAQESFQMRSFAVANCMVVIDENVEEIKKGSLVEIHILP